MKNRTNSQSGNAFILILVGVFLFGALMFTFGRSAEKGTGNLTKQQAKIAAQEILNYAQAVEGAVDRVRRKGCSESEISFENAVVAGYSNPNARPDKSCNVFETEGGKISYQTTENSMLDSSKSGHGYYKQVVFVGGFRIVDLGTSNTELLMYIPFLKETVCRETNNILDIQNILSSDDVFGGGGGGGNFNGESNDFDPFTTPDLGDEVTAIKGKPSFCIKYDNSFHFFHSLIIR